MTEVPVGYIETSRGLRHAQVTALSLREMRAAILHARDSGLAALTFVSHSFELLSRDRLRVNHLVRHRFERLCRTIEATPGVRCATYRDDPPCSGGEGQPSPTLPHSRVRSAMRMAEQAVANVLYGP